MRRKLDDRSILLRPRDRRRATSGAVSCPRASSRGVQLESVLRRLCAGARATPTSTSCRSRSARSPPTSSPARRSCSTEGELPNVMRASMSVPGAIAPAEIDGQHAGRRRAHRQPAGRRRARDGRRHRHRRQPRHAAARRARSSTSLLGVTAQMVNILTEQNVQASLASLGPDRHPDRAGARRLLGGRLRRPGEDRADRRGGGAQGRRPARAPRDRRPTRTPRCESGARTRARRRLARRSTRSASRRWSASIPSGAARLMETQAGVPLEPEALDRDMRRLFGTGDFEHVELPHPRGSAAGACCVVDAVEKSWGPELPALRPRASAPTSRATRTSTPRRATADVAERARRANGAPTCRSASTSRLATEFYQPLCASRALFVAPRIELERRSARPLPGQRSASRATTSRSRRRARRRQRVRAHSARSAWAWSPAPLTPSLETGPPELAPPRGASHQGAFTRSASSTTSSTAPTSRATAYAGIAHLFASTPALGADARYTRWDTDLAAALLVRPPHRAGRERRRGRRRRPPARYDLFLWGGFLQQSGYAPARSLGQRLEFGRLVYYYKRARARLFEGAYVGVSLEAGRLGGPLVPGGPTGMLKSVAAFFAVDTPVGPFYLGYGGRATATAAPTCTSAVPDGGSCRKGRAHGGPPSNTDALRGTG